MTYFEGLDRFGFPEDDERDVYFGAGNLSVMPGTFPDESGSWLMGGPNTGVDDALGVALYGLGFAWLLPGPGYAASAAVGARVAGPSGAIAGMAAWAIGSLAVMGAGHGLRSLD